MKITPINGKIETEGATLLYRGVKLLVARSGNVNFKKVFREEMKPFNDEFEAGRISNDQSSEIMILCIAKSILVGWETFKDTDGNNCAYSEDNAIELLTDDRDVYDAVIKHSENVENYISDKEEKTKAKS